MIPFIESKLLNRHPREWESSVWRSLLFNVSIVILIFLLAIFLGIQLNNERLIMEGLHTRAKSDFENILQTRLWNAQHGGVYVEKLPGVVSNPYLDNPDITALDGRVYTKKNPALMTREISELTSLKSGHSFHITSLNPLNPANKPDAFETEALREFEAGKSEAFTTEKVGERLTYRYMAPLHVEPPCLTCHAKQGYKAGDVRGGISVIFDISDVGKRLRWNRYVIWGLSLTIFMLLITIIYTIVRKVKLLLDEANAKLRTMAVTDELTGLHNRRFFMQRIAEEFSKAKRYRRSLACMMIDIDLFKQVNDSYGHQIGDEVLQSIAHLMVSQDRTSDVLARYGGEEFIVLLPEIDLKGAVQAAERLRTAVGKNHFVLDDGRSLQVTISIGVSYLSGEQIAVMDNYQDLIRAADDALYRAKANGRNRVEAA